MVSEGDKHMTKDAREELPIEVLETEYGLWGSYVKMLKNKGYETIWYPQIQAFKSGALDDDNFIFISSPGSGKTLVAEVILLHSFLKSTKAGAYLVPFNELANEIYENFKERMESPEIGLKVTKSTMDDENLSELQRSNIMIMTYEKFDYYLRNHTELISDLGVVVIDEFHIISDENRGSKLELIIAKLLHRFPHLRIVGLSAVIPNGDEIRDWLNATLCDTSDWRKNPLYEGVYDHQSKVIRFYDSSGNLSHEEEIGNYVGNPTYNLTIDFIKKEMSRGGLPQTLIFAPTRKDTRDFATGIQKGLSKDTEERISPHTLEGIANNLKNLEGSDTKTLRGLIEAVKNGIAFHHAGLGSDVKRVVMDAFRNQDLLVMISTTTLSAGVNLPAKRVIISKPRIRGVRGRDLTVAEYKNLAGRAGRPKYTDEHGECVIISVSPAIAESYKNKYILAEPEKIESRIDLSKDYDSLLNLLRDYPSVDKLVEIMEKTFYGYRGLSHENLRLSVERGVEMLEKWGFVERNGELFNLTELGRSVSKQIINPLSAHIILKNLRAYLDRDIDHELIRDILLAICSTPEFDGGNRFWMRSRYYYKGREKVQERLGLGHLDLKDVDQVILTTKIIEKYISEEKYTEIFKTDKLDTEYWAYSDIKERIAPRFSTTIRTIQQIIEESETELHNKFGRLLDDLKIMTLYGIKQEHVDFVRKGITSNRNTIILLERIGIPGVSELLNKDVRWLGAQLGKNEALKLKRRAVYNLLEGFERERELILLEAYEKGIELSLFENLFSSSENGFWIAVKNMLSRMDDIFEIYDHDHGSDSIPEADIYIKGDEGNLLNDGDGNPIKVCLECKSTKALDKPVRTTTALEVLKKCPEGRYTYRVVIGTPSFEGDAGNRAEEHRILLIPVTVFARIFLLKEEGKINTKIIDMILQKTGELTLDGLNEILKG